MGKRILVAVDGSDQAKEAVRYISKILPYQQIEIVLFNVMSKIPELLWDMSGDPAFHLNVRSAVAWEVQHEKTINQFMKKARDVLIGAGVSPETITINVQERKKGIARDIAIESQNGYDALVVGRTGLSKFKDFIMGNVANKLVETLSRIPICVVGGKPKPGKILVGLDSSEGAMKAVKYVGSLFAGSDFEVTLFNAIEDIGMIPLPEDLFTLEDKENWLEIVKKEIDPVLDEAKNHLIKAGIESNRITLKSLTQVKSRAGAIVEEAKKGEYGTIVVGRRGLSKIEEFFMGRVSNKVIQLSKAMAVWVVN